MLKVTIESVSKDKSELLGIAETSDKGTAAPPFHDYDVQLFFAEDMSKAVRTGSITKLLRMRADIFEVLSLALCACGVDKNAAGWLQKPQQPEQDKQKSLREKRAQTIAAMNLVTREGDSPRFKVATPSLRASQQFYELWRDDSGKVRCTCTEFTEAIATDSAFRCEHILAVKFWLLSTQRQKTNAN